MGHIVLLLVVPGCSILGPPRVDRMVRVPAVDQVLGRMQEALQQGDLERLRDLFTPQCRNHCRGFVPLIRAKAGGYQAATWVPRVDHKEPALLDLMRILFSYQALRVSLAPQRMRVLDGRVLVRARLRLEGVDGEDQRRIDEGLLDLDLRQGPSGWKVHGFSPAAVNTLRRDSPIYRRQVLPSAPRGPAPVVASPGLGPTGQQAPASPVALDLDRDGVVDLVLARGDEALLLRGRGGGGFNAPRALFRQAGLRVLRAGDLDGDGHPDLFAGSYGGTSHIWRWRSAGLRRMPGFVVHGHVTDASIADLDGDGRLDLYVVRHGDPARWPAGGEPDLLFLGTPEGLRPRVPATGGGWSLAVCVGDLNDDGRVDLFVARELGPSRLLINRGGARFHDAAHAMGLHLEQATACALGDVDGDGRLDLMVGGRRGAQAPLFGRPGVGFPGDGLIPSTTRRRRLQRAALGDTLWLNDGRRMRRRWLLDSGWTNWAGMLDHDNDGALDLLLLRRQPSPPAEQQWWWSVLGPALRGTTPAPMREALQDGPTRLWVGLGSGELVDGASVAGLDLAGGVALALDSDGDGRLDLVGDGTSLHIDTNDEGHGLLLALQGRPPNRQAVGSRVTLWAGGRRQIREAGLSASGLPGGPPGMVHFGTGEALRAEQVQVRWPDGSVQRFVDLPLDRLVRLRQGGHASWGDFQGDADADQPDATVEPASSPTSAPLTAWRPPARVLELTIRQGAMTLPLSQRAGQRATLVLFVHQPTTALCAALGRLAHRGSGVRAVVIRMEGEGGCAERATEQTRAALTGASALLPLLMVVDRTGRTVRMVSGEVEAVGLGALIDGL